MILNGMCCDEVCALHIFISLDPYCLRAHSAQIYPLLTGSEAAELRTVHDMLVLPVIVIMNTV